MEPYTEEPLSMEHIHMDQKKGPGSGKKPRKNIKYSAKKSESSELSEDNKTGPGSYEEFFSTVQNNLRKANKDPDKEIAALEGNILRLL